MQENDVRDGKQVEIKENVAKQPLRVNTQNVNI